MGRRKERHPGVRHNGGLESDGVEEAVTEVGRMFMGAWRKEEEDAARCRQEKREATRLGTLLSHTEAA